MHFNKISKAVSTLTLKQTILFSKFPRGACPRIPLDARASGVPLVRLLFGLHPPAKNPAYGPATRPFSVMPATEILENEPCYGR